MIDALDEPELPSALAILAGAKPAETIRHVGGRLRLASREWKTAAWLHDAVAALGATDAEGLARLPWSRVQPWLAHRDAFLLADLLRARAAHGAGAGSAAAWVTEKLRLPRETLDPPPLLTGDELLEAGVPPGREVGLTLARLRDLQLDGVVTTREAALAWLGTRGS
jgi:hypothetical protein